MTSLVRARHRSVTLLDRNKPRRPLSDVAPSGATLRWIALLLSVELSQEGSSHRFHRVLSINRTYLRSNPKEQALCTFLHQPVLLSSFPRLPSRSELTQTYPAQTGFCLSSCPSIRNNEPLHVTVRLREKEKYHVVPCGRLQSGRPLCFICCVTCIQHLTKNTSVSCILHSL